MLTETQLIGLSVGFGCMLIYVLVGILFPKFLGSKIEVGYGTAGKEGWMARAKAYDELYKKQMEK